MQAEAGLISTAFDYVIHGGSMGVILFGAVVFLKVNDRLKRDESLRKDYPPHRHIGTNGSSVIVYPEDYQPGKIDRLGT